MVNENHSFLNKQRLEGGVVTGVTVEEKGKKIANVVMASSKTDMKERERRKNGNTSKLYSGKANEI